MQKKFHEKSGGWKIDSLGPGGQMVGFLGSIFLAPSVP